MKFITAILILALAAVCAAQPDRPQIAILAAEEGCAPQDVQRDIICGCFITLFGAPTNRAVRDRCEEVTGSPVRNSQSACDAFLIENNTNYDFQAILDRLGDIKERCFGGDITFARNLLADIAINFAILQNAEQLFILVNQICELFGLPTVSDIPSLARLIDENDPHLKAQLLRKFNNL